MERRPALAGSSWAWMRPQNGIYRLQHAKARHNVPEDAVQGHLTPGPALIHHDYRQHCARDTDQDAKRLDGSVTGKPPLRGSSVRRHMATETSDHDASRDEHTPRYVHENTVRHLDGLVPDCGTSTGLEVDTHHAARAAVVAERVAGTVGIRNGHVAITNVVVVAVTRVQLARELHDCLAIRLADQCGGDVLTGLRNDTGGTLARDAVLLDCRRGAWLGNDRMALHHGRRPEPDGQPVFAVTQTAGGEHGMRTNSPHSARPTRQRG